MTHVMRGKKREKTLNLFVIFVTEAVPLKGVSRDTPIANTKNKKNIYILRHLILTQH